MTAYGRYELLERIGQGPLTDVFKAKRHGVEGFEKVLVVKRLRGAQANEPSFVQSFIQRAQLALKLSHSNVVHVLDLGEVEHIEPKSYFLATEFVAGATLADVLRLRREQKQPLPLEMALHLSAEVCRALDHAHRRQDSLGRSLGITHDNLTAENIFLSDEGEVKVADFCTAVLGLGDTLYAGSEAMDLNAMGALLYEMLRLEPPPTIAPASTFTGFGLPVDDLMGRLLMGDPALSAADVHEQLLVYAYACNDWVGPEQVRELVNDFRSVRPDEAQDTYPSQLPKARSSRPPLEHRGVSPGLTSSNYRAFVGRSAETNRVGRRLAIVAHRKLQAVGIVGPPGIGKTRFVVELRQRLMKGGLNLGFYIVRCPVGGRQQPYSGVVAMLRALFGLSGAHAVDREGLVVALRTLGLSGPRASAILCELGANASTDGSAPPLRAAVERVMSSLADDRMHVFAWDNAEELDEPSIQLLAAASEALATKRVALMFAARELPSAELLKIDGFEEVRLEALDASALKRLVQVRLGVAELPGELEGLLTSRTEGNPLLLEELLREALLNGTMQVTEGAISGFDLEGLSLLPATLQEQLSARLRRLGPDEQTALRLVARLDEWADVARLALALGRDREATLSLLSELVEHNLLVVEQERIRLPTRLIEAALVLDATPDQLTALELRVAEALLLGGSDDARLLEQAARHLETAGEPLRAAEAYERAARARAENARPERTVPLLLSALELVPLETRSLDSIAGCIQLLSQSPLVRGDYPRLADMVRRLSTHLLARPEVERDGVLDALLELVKVQRSSLHFHEAQQLLRSMRALCKHHPGRLTQVLLQLADTQIALGDYQPAIETLASLEHVSEDRQEAQRHEALVLGAHAHAQAGERAAALALLDRAERLSGAGEAQRALRRLQVRALTHALGGEWELSGQAAANAASHARALGHSPQETAYRHYEGEALTNFGQYARAYAAFRSSLALARDIGSERWVNRNQMLLAFLEGREGSKEATRRIEDALEVAERQRETQDVAKGRLLLGCLIRLEGEEAAAQREFALARQIAIAIGHGLLVSECDAAMAQAG